MGKSDKKAGDTSAAKGKAGGGKETGGGKAKGAQSINVRHILVIIVPCHLAAPPPGLQTDASRDPTSARKHAVRKAQQEGGGPGEAQGRRQIRRRGPHLFRGQGPARFVAHPRGRSQRSRCQKLARRLLAYSCKRNCLRLLLWLPRRLSTADSHSHGFLAIIGGSLGWKNKGSLDPKFEEVAFALEPSTTSNPSIGEAKTGFGYHIIMVLLARLAPPWESENPLR